MKRLFIAVRIELNAAFSGLYEELRRKTVYDDIVWTEKDVQHLTIRFLGKTPDEKIEPLISMLDEVLLPLPSFHLEINRLGVFGSRYRPTVLWLGFKESAFLSGLFRTIEAQLKLLAFEPDYGNFVPHLTLGRIKKIDNKKRFRELVEKLQPAFTQSVKISEIILYQSKLTNNGPIYREIKKFPLLDG